MERGISIVQFKLEYETTRNKMQRNPFALVQHSKRRGRDASATLIDAERNVVVGVQNFVWAWFDVVDHAYSPVLQLIGIVVFGG